MDASKMTNDTEKKVQPSVIKEGQAEILVYETKNVFYNPVQEFNRDLSIAVLSLFARCQLQANNTKRSIAENDSSTNEDGITVLEALAASGLRSIRYAKEVENIKYIIANDISEKAVETMKKNIAHNKVDNLVRSSHSDATMVMYQNRKTRFDAIDLDPYGCPSIFLDAAVQSVSEGGLLLVTATDMAVLAGNSPETCYVKYGAVSIKSKACHEISLRILLQHIASHAARYGRYIKPLLSISVDFYIRVYVQVYTSQLKCKENTTKLGYLYQCTGCESMTMQPLGARKPNGGYKLPNGPVVNQRCEICNHSFHIGGPIWLDPLHDKDFVENLLYSIDNINLGTAKRIQGVLNVVREELDCPLYYTLDRLMSIVKCNVPPMMVFRSAILNAGYKVSYSHANKNSIKTDAPNSVIWDIVRAWEKEHPAKREKMDKTGVAYTILNAESLTEVSLKCHPDANPKSRQQQLQRFAMNPSAYWGPGTRATAMIDREGITSKRKKNQAKRSGKKKRDEGTDQEDTTETCKVLELNV